jgi:hypothetical protein
MKKALSLSCVVMVLTIALISACAPPTPVPPESSPSRNFTVVTTQGDSGVTITYLGKVPDMATTGLYLLENHAKGERCYILFSGFSPVMTCIK